MSLKDDSNLKIILLYNSFIQCASLHSFQKNIYIFTVSPIFLSFKDMYLIFNKKNIF